MNKQQKYLRIIHVLIVLALLSELLISARIWVPGSRLTPEISAFEGFPLQIPLWLNYILYVLILIGVPATLLRKWGRKAFWLTVFVCGVTILEDISRLQPWLYVQLLLVLALLQKPDKEKSIDKSFPLLLWVMAGTYLWAGMLKQNAHFANQLFPWLMSEPFGLEEFLLNNKWISHIVAAVESCVGILLLLPKTRRLACLMGMATHLILFISLGIGHGINEVVWPWNLLLFAMLLVLYLLNSKESVLHIGQIFNWKQKLVVGLCCLMPALNYAGWWDAHLSFSLYSGVNTRCSFYFQELNAPLNNDPVVLESVVQKENFPGLLLLPMTFWYVNETHVPVYPEERYYKRVGRHLCNCVPDPSQAGIVLIVREPFTSEPQATFYTCDQGDW